MPADINTRATAALRRLEAAGRIRSTLWKCAAVADDSGATGVVVALGPKWQTDNDFWKPQNCGAIGEGLAVFRPGYGLTSTNGWLHDLSDLVTAAALIVLVREAYADPAKLWGGRVEVHQDHHAIFRVVQPYHDDGGALRYRSIASGPTEVEALVAAIEAAADGE